ncbi:MAG: hypothetical protein ACI8ZN_000965 [Bacteroidia bacterium]|jgi:hypothetical protein
MKAQKLFNGKIPSGIFLLLLSVLFFASCTDDDPVANKDKQDVQFEATDAAIDHANVNAVMVTVAELWVNGSKVEGFQATTLELSALTEGKTALMREAQLDATSITEVSLVLDYNKDEAGNAPGCYVLKADGKKDELRSDLNQINLKTNIDLLAESTTKIVLDFDLRKMIKEESGDFEFVTGAEMSAYVRTVHKAQAGMVRGTLNGADTSGRKLVAYIYEKGTFNANAETSGSGSSKVQFANAVNSDQINADGEFVLAFINKGEYEIIVIEYKDTNRDGTLEITGKAELMTAGSILFNGTEVKANSETSLDLQLNAILPI